MTLTGMHVILTWAIACKAMAELGCEASLSLAFFRVKSMVEPVRMLLVLKGIVPPELLEDDFLTVEWQSANSTHGESSVSFGGQTTGGDAR